jgi:hypothetical protein
MLRTAAFCLAIALPGLAAAEPAQNQFPRSVIGAEVHGVDGTVIGRVTAVERDADGNIVAVEAPGLEPADAPDSVREYVAENNTRRARLLVSDRGDAEQRAGAARDVRAR